MKFWEHFQNISYVNCEKYYFSIYFKRFNKPFVKILRVCKKISNTREILRKFFAMGKIAPNHWVNRSLIVLNNLLKDNTARQIFIVKNIFYIVPYCQTASKKITGIDYTHLENLASLPYPGVYTAPLPTPPPNARLPPSPAHLAPKPTAKILVCSRGVWKMTIVPEDGRETG